jgi:hypothetical protein
MPPDRRRASIEAMGPIGAYVEDQQFAAEILDQQILAPRSWKSRPAIRILWHPFTFV